MQVDMYPSPFSHTMQNSGMGMVIDNLRRSLEKLGVTFGTEGADVVHAHAGARTALWGLPAVETVHGFYWTEDPGYNTMHHAINRDVVQATFSAREIVAPRQ